MKIDKRRPCFKFERWAELYYIKKGYSGVKRNVVYTVRNRKTKRVVRKYQIDVEYAKVYFGINVFRLFDKELFLVEVKNRKVNKKDINYFYEKIKTIDAVAGEILTSRNYEQNLAKYARNRKITIIGPSELAKTKICKGRTLDEQIRNIGTDYSVEETQKTAYE
ncbi:hypothetical protein KY311_02785 [Candidatus Woesearchaeota archaeon]|nr:hypothetical protein [Candidatus Woesearchaeota archaeon]MBW3016809.1 hypothetical protein [Candidatus Woesearchaeota archaeon]